MFEINRKYNTEKIFETQVRDEYIHQIMDFI